MVEGFKIVLTSDRTLMSEYNGHIFLGFSACMPRGLIPDKVYFSLFCPSVKVDSGGLVKFAPCGARRIEAALLSYGFKREDVAVAHPEHLDKVVGPRTKVIGMTENDPLGIGPATSTFTQLFGGEAYMAIKFKQLLTNRYIKTFSPKLIVGGEGAWQIDPETQQRLGIDCVVLGEGERIVGPLFEKAINGGVLPAVVHGETVPSDAVPPLIGPTIQGIVEISRGCGRGCAFCEPTMRSLRHFSIGQILNDVEVNLRGGSQPLLHAEDILRYKATGLTVNKEAVVELFKAVKNYPGVQNIGISHIALSSVCNSPGTVEEISNILELGKGKWLGGQTGIETGSPKLIRDHLAGKCKPYTPEDWPDVVVNSFDILTRNNWVPCSTLIFGLPEETEEDVNRTIDLVEELAKFRSLIIPLFLVSMGRLRNDSESFTIKKMTPAHTELLLKCWDHNLTWIPMMSGEFGSRKVRYGLKYITSYGIKRAKHLIQRCRSEYDCDIQAMIADLRHQDIDGISKVKAESSWH